MIFLLLWSDGNEFRKAFLGLGFVSWWREKPFGLCFEVNFVSISERSHEAPRPSGSPGDSAVYSSQSGGQTSSGASGLR